MLGACGAALVLTAPPANQARAAASLLSRSNWVLATALPASQDVPADWGYSLTGRLRRAVSPSTVPPAALPNTSRAAVYSPAGCGNIPKILDHSSADLAAYVQIDRDVQVFGQDAPLDAAATGESDERGPNARFALWAVADGPARIANYLDWLNRCGSYQVTNHFLDGTVKNERTVTTEVEALSAGGADAAVAVTRTFTTADGRDPSSTYHVAYYAVRGVLLECTSYLQARPGSAEAARNPNSAEVARVMSGSARLRDSQRSGLIAAALCVLATAAVLITAPAVHSALRSGASGRQPLAPRLAALSDQELAQLLPKQSEFPASWTVDETTELSDTFGYFKYHVFDEGLGFDPIECFGVVGVASTGAFDAAQVFGHDPAAQVAVADGKDILLTVGREFDRSGFDAFVGLVSRCLRFGSAVAGSYTVRILEDSRPTAGPQRFRYSLTTTISAEPADETRTDYYSYGRTSGLILTGSAGSGHQQALDALFDITLQRIVER